MIENIPQELRALPQWVVHKSKCPYIPGTNCGAKAGDPFTWRTFDQALAALNGGGYDGLGFEFHNNGIVGVDLDHVVEPGGSLKQWAADVVGLLNSYTEYSPSGTGLHIYVKGSIPVDGKKHVVNKETGEAIEMYQAKRYFTVTGNVYLQRPIEERPGIALLFEKYFPEKKAAPPPPVSSYNAPAYLKTGLDKDPVFRALWEGHRGTADESANDIALMNKLAFWCSRDVDLMVSAFRSSPYAAQKDEQHRAKLERDDYLLRTARKAAQDCRDTAAERDAMFQLEHQRKPTQPGPSEKLKTISAQELQNKELPPAKYVVAEMLPQGLSLLASPPKYGKSWFVLDMCLSVAAGQSFLKHQTVKSGCLYLALEDSERRLKDRMNKVLCGDVAPGCFDYAITAKDIANGLIDQLQDYLNTHLGTGLIVIDTLQKVRSTTSNKENAYGADYKEMTILKRFADMNGICLLVVHHLRKSADDGDVFNRISGTNGIFGAVDTAMAMSKQKRTDDKTTLSITGRDVEASDTVISFNKDSYRWQVEGTLEEQLEERRRAEYNSDPMVVTVRGLLEQSPLGWSGTASDLFQACIDIAKVYPAETPSIIGKKLKQFAPLLYEYDGIIYKAPSSPSNTGGKATRKHTLYYSPSHTLS